MASTVCVVQIQYARSIACALMEKMLRASSVLILKSASSTGHISPSIIFLAGSMIRWVFPISSNKQRCDAPSPWHRFSASQQGAVSSGSSCMILSPRVSAIVSWRMSDVCPETYSRIGFLLRPGYPGSRARSPPWLSQFPMPICIGLDSYGLIGQTVAYTAASVPSWHGMPFRQETCEERVFLPGIGVVEGEEMFPILRW